MRNLIYLLIFVFSLSLFSCKKCITCEIKFESSPGDTSSRYMDDCARRGKKIDEFEELATEVADSLMGTAICITE